MSFIDLGKFFLIFSESKSKIKNSKRIQSNLFSKFSEVHSWVQIVNQKIGSVCITLLSRLSKLNKAQYKCFARPTLQSSNKTDSLPRRGRRSYRFFAQAYKDHALLCALNIRECEILKSFFLKVCRANVADRYFTLAANSSHSSAGSNESILLLNSWLY